MCMIERVQPTVAVDVSTLSLPMDSITRPRPSETSLYSNVTHPISPNALGIM
jgi:hypothetical protein